MAAASRPVEVPTPDASAQRLPSAQLRRARPPCADAPSTPPPVPGVQRCADCYICPSCPIGRPPVRRFDARPLRPLILVAIQGFHLKSHSTAIALPPHAIFSLSVRKRRKEGV